MLAVLDQATADLQSTSFNVRRRALAWFLATGTRANHLFAFSRICQVFGCDPAAVRVRLLARFHRKGEATHQVQARRDKAAG